jgi:D-alanine-D-alanine ligase
MTPMSAHAASGSAAWPKVLILYNENPAWPAEDRAWTQRMVRQLSGALRLNGLHHQPLCFFDSLSRLDAYDPREWLIWNWGEELNGQPWTDAVVAAELEARGFAFTGASARVLALSVDRMNIKQRLRAAGLPTLPAQRFTNPAEAALWADYPAIVKGCTQHGSFGIEPEAVVYSVEELAQRIAYLRAEWDTDALVEPFLDTREFHVALLGNGRVQPLPPVEYDYAAFHTPRERLFAYSYKHDSSAFGYHAVRLRCPAPLDNDRWRARLQEIAVAAYEALGLSDYGRIDLRMLGDEPQVLDVNANCDLDLTSALMRSARVAGLPYHAVVGRIVQHAAERMQD